MEELERNRKAKHVFCWRIPDDYINLYGCRRRPDNDSSRCFFSSIDCPFPVPSCEQPAAAAELNEQDSLFEENLPDVSSLRRNPASAGSRLQCSYAGVRWTANHLRSNQPFACGR
jgi:hypothetical protein